MVSKWRSGIYYHVLLYGARHDTRHRIFILGPRTSEVRALYDLGRDGFFFGRYDTVVFLGLLAGVLDQWHNCIYWEFGTFWVDEDPW